MRNWAAGKGWIELTPTSESGDLKETYILRRLDVLVHAGKPILVNADDNTDFLQAGPSMRTCFLEWDW